MTLLFHACVIVIGTILAIHGCALIMAIFSGFGPFGMLLGLILAVAFILKLVSWI